jgi:hypothetical protein
LFAECLGGVTPAGHADSMITALVPFGRFARGAMTGEPKSRADTCAAARALQRGLLGKAFGGKGLVRRHRCGAFKG